MSRVCDICGRGPQKSAMRSHANNKTLRKQYLNLQTKVIEGAKKKVCTKCMRTMKKNMA